MIINSFGYILSGFQHFFIFLMKNGYRHSSSKKYAKMVLFGLKTYFKKFFLGYFHPPTLPTQKNRVKMVPKQVFTRAGIKSPPPYSMSIPEAPSCRVNDIYQIRTDPPYDNYEIRNCDKNKKMYLHSPSRNCDIILSHTISFNRRQALIVE